MISLVNIPKKVFPKLEATRPAFMLKALVASLLALLGSIYFSDYFDFEKDLYIFHDINCLFPTVLFPFNLIISPSPSYCDQLFEKNSLSMSKNSASSCVFCSINLKQGPNPIRYQDEKYLVFDDINPSAAFHYLVVPKSHIDSVDNLTSIDTQMVREMYEVGILVLKKMGVKDMILGFHVPPFTSIPHLHLHAIGLPFKSFWRSMKYPKQLRTPWFINAQEFITKLEKQRIVKK